MVHPVWHFIMKMYSNRTYEMLHCGVHITVEKFIREKNFMTYSNLALSSLPKMKRKTGALSVTDYHYWISLFTLQVQNRKSHSL